MLPVRPDKLNGITTRIDTPAGAMHLTINEDEDGAPIETFVHLGKKGEHSHAMAEAIGRLISCWLRAEELGTRRDRAELIVDQLLGIGGGDPAGLGPSRVSSVPDGIAQCIKTFLEETSDPVVLEGSSTNRNVVL
jgi:ribonucleoside-diphosphate reductase alpha chain